MKVFLDANILVSVLNKEYPQYMYTARILSMADNKKNTLVTTSICLAIAFYFAEKKHGAVEAKKRINLLAEHINIADCGGRETISALKNKKVHDLEDGFQYYAALNANCTCIVSNDTDDFYFSDLPVLNAESFFRKHVD